MSRTEIDKALFGHRRGARIRVAPPEERTADNIVFDSKHEMERYLVLKMHLRAGIIFDLELQPAFPIFINGRKICTYKADFRYRDLDGRITIEDAKGMRTEIYSLKCKLVEAVYNIRILEP